MGEETAIEWCDHTFNPWIGCTKISPACDHCYAEAYAKRTGQAELWDHKRRRTRPDNWSQVLKWNRAAAQAGVRRRVFCASLADVFDNEVDPAWRTDLLRLIAATTHLDFLLLTKRIGNATAMLEAALADIGVVGTWSEAPWKNVWIGATVVTQAEVDRDLPKLLAVPAARRFLSIEPMLEMIYLHLSEHVQMADCCGEPNCEHCDGSGQQEVIGLHWIIVGGESGPHARQMKPAWARFIRDQADEIGLPLLFKQWGTYTEAGCALPEHAMYQAGFRVGDKKGGRLLDGIVHHEFPDSAA